MPRDVLRPDDSFLRLHAACWSIGGAVCVHRGIPVRLITGTRGAIQIRVDQGITR